MFGVSRADIVVAVAGVVRANLPEGFEETPHYKAMITWVVPLDRSPKTYNRSALPVCALGERKSYVSLYLMALHFDRALSVWLDRAWKETGCPLDRGKVAIRMRKLEEVPLDVIAEAIARVSVDDLIAGYERVSAR